MLVIVFQGTVGIKIIGNDELWEAHLAQKHVQPVLINLRAMTDFAVSVRDNGIAGEGQNYLKRIAEKNFPP